MAMVTSSKSDENQHGINKPSLSGPWSWVSITAHFSYIYNEITIRLYLFIVLRVFYHLLEVIMHTTI